MIRSVLIVVLAVLALTGCTSDQPTAAAPAPATTASDVVTVRCDGETFTSPAQAWTKPRGFCEADVPASHTLTSVEGQAMDTASDAQLADLYAWCAQNGPATVTVTRSRALADPAAVSDRADDIQAQLILCRDHPDLVPLRRLVVDLRLAAIGS